MIYDVAVIGAGPAGLLAAKTASELGMKTVLVEKRKDVSKITRACSMQFILDDGYENEYVQLQDDKILFTRNGFSVDYNGKTHDLTHKYYISPGGSSIHFANSDGSPFAVKFEKGVLLEQLRQACEKSGAELREHTVCYDAYDGSDGTTVLLSEGGTKSTIKARKLIAADGANSRMTEALGMNGQRKLFTVALCIIFLVEGIKDYDPHAWKRYMGKAFSPNAGVTIAPSFYDGVADVIIGARTAMPPDRMYHEITTNYKLAPLFQNARVIDKFGCSLKAFTSLKVPHKGNVLAVGDAAAYVEVEVQGALMCGFRAAHAVKRELEGKNGYNDYSAWWGDSFEFNSDEYLRVAQGYALSPTYSDAELDYLFALTEDQVLEGTYSQYKSPKLMWDSILRHKQRIKKDRPEIYAKIKKNRELILQ